MHIVALKILQTSVVRLYPWTFNIGCCATFAAGGDWQLVVPLLLGGVFGYLMKAITGLWLHANQLNLSEVVEQITKQQAKAYEYVKQRYF